MSKSPIMPPTQVQYGAFATLFQHFNALLFHGELHQPMLVFSRKKMTYGTFRPNTWAPTDDRTKTTHEIALNADQLNRCTNEDIAATLVHEQCHQWHMEFGKPGRHGYHNLEFARIMREVGLQTTDDGTPEGKSTGEKITHIIVEGGPFQLAFRELAHDVFLPFTLLDGSARG